MQHASQQHQQGGDSTHYHREPVSNSHTPHSNQRHHTKKRTPPSKDIVVGKDEHYAYVMVCTDATESLVFSHSIFAGRKRNRWIVEGVRIVLYNFNRHTLHLNCRSTSKLGKNIAPRIFPEQYDMQVQMDMHHVGWVLLPKNHRGFVEGSWMSRNEYESYLLKIPWQEAEWFEGSEMGEKLREIRARRRAFQAGQRAVVKKKFAQMRQQRIAFQRLQKLQYNQFSNIGKKNFAQRRRQRHAFRVMKSLYSTS